MSSTWEINNSPNKKLKTQLSIMDQFVSENEPPKDRRNIVYWILVLHGIGILMPWNMFINAKSYFVDYKLGNDYLGHNLHYASIFMADLTICSQLPSLLFNWLNIFCPIGCVAPKYSGIAGMFGAAVLLTGICCGILFGMITPFIVKHLSM